MGHLNMLLPAEHLLRHYKERFPKYDRFLPILASYLPYSSSVIDVGSNIGDTAIAMYSQNRNLIFHCFEPDKRFFRYLKFNTRNHKKSFFLYRTFVTSEAVAMKLDGRNGTRWRSNQEDWKTSATSLDSIFANSASGQISLLKSDVDGWDFDVVNSAFNLIDQHKPLLFLEIYTKDLSTLEKYMEVFDLLSQKGYVNGYFFKNTGELCMKLPLEKAREFLTSNLVPHKGFRHATYFDILCSTENNDSIASMSTEFFKLTP
jgi:FkbM family methyltransferase